MRKKKRTIKRIEIFLEILLFLLMFVGVPCLISEVENHYKMTGYVIETNNDEILIEDITGNIWAIFDGDFHVGDKVRVTFFNNYTDNKRVDDEIIEVVKIKYR